LNKSYKSIWCEKTGTFVAAAEISRAKGKKSSSGVVGAAVVAVAGLTGLMAPPMALAATAPGSGSLQMCQAKVTGPSYVVDGATYKTVGDALAAAASAGGGGGTDPNAVLYDTSAHNSVTLGKAGAPVAIYNVASGAVSASSTDAVNGSPTYNVGGKTVNNVGDAFTNIDGRVTENTTNIETIEGDITNITNILGAGGAVGLVQQDVTTKNITVAKDLDGAVVDFAAKDGSTRTLSNVTAGTADTDAVNMSQLKATGLVNDSGKTLEAVTYDARSDKGSITLGGANGTQLKNVADGKDDTDAVNVNQLKQAGLVDAKGKTLDAVTYDAGTDRSKVTFGDVGAPPVLLSNVGAGVANTDAANVGQLRGIALSLGGSAGRQSREHRVGRLGRQRTRDRQCGGRRDGYRCGEQAPTRCRLGKQSSLHRRAHQPSAVGHRQRQARCQRCGRCGHGGGDVAAVDHPGSRHGFGGGEHHGRRVGGGCGRLQGGREQPLGHQAGRHG
jgi:autotransporter adhesin